MFANGGSPSGPDGAPGWIDAEDGTILNSGIYSTIFAGGGEVLVTDAIAREFTVSQTGHYVITINARALGKASSFSGAYQIPLNWAAFDWRLYASLSGPGVSSKYRLEILDRGMDVSLFGILESLGPSDATFLEELVDVVVSGEFLTVDEIEFLLSQVDRLPYFDVSSETRTLYLEANLEAGTTYTWEFGASSLTYAFSAGFAAQNSLSLFGACLDDVTIQLTGGAPPQVNSFFHDGSPIPVVYNGALTLHASASDADGAVTRVEFFRDSNGNSILDLGPTGDEYVGSDSIPQGAQWDWTVDPVLWSPGTHRFFARALDDEGRWSAAASQQVSIGLSPAVPGSDFTQTGEVWSDATAQGDGDGVLEAGERMRLGIRLRSTAGASDVEALLSTSDSCFNIPAPGVYFQPFDAGESQWSIGSFEVELDCLFAPGETRTTEFSVQVTYELYGWEYVQYLTFNKTFYRDGDIAADFEVVLPIAIDDDYDPIDGFRNNGDGVLQTGEVVRLRPTVRNVGQGSATDPDIEFYVSAVSPLEIRGGSKRYENIPAGATGLPLSGEYRVNTEDDLSFTGTVSVGMRIDWDENGDPAPLDIPDAFQLSVAPTPVIDVNPEIHNFGVVAPGEPLNYTITVLNGGSGVLDVSDIHTSDGDTSVQPANAPFYLSPGESRDVTVTLDTSAIPSGTTIERQISVVSNGLLGEAIPPSDQSILTGLVSDAALVFVVPGTPGAQPDPDIFGKRVVWRDSRNGNPDIYLYDLIGGVEEQITSNPAPQTTPRIFGNFVAWEDDRNQNPSGNPANTDIYAYDTSEGVEFAVADSLSNEELLGIDEGRIAYLRQDFAFDSFSGQQEGYNLYYYDLDSDEAVQVTSYSASPGTPVWSVNPDRGDFADGVLTWRALEYPWDAGANRWGSGASRIAKYAIDADAAPIIVEAGFDAGPATAEGRIVWTDEDAGSDSQVYVWQPGGSGPQQITMEERDFGVDALAFAGDLVTYDKKSMPGLYYWDLSNSQEHLLTESPDYCEFARMDAGGVIWVGYDPGETVFVAFPQCGNGAKDLGEQCDDGNTVDGDGCSAVCVLPDSDGDGVPDDGAVGDVPCQPGQTEDCDDNCPEVWNADQADGGGIGASSGPDGVGDACQCGDVNWDHQVTATDATILFNEGRGNPTGALLAPGLADVNGNGLCTTGDATILFNFLRGVAGASIPSRCFDPELTCP